MTGLSNDAAPAVTPRLGDSAQSAPVAGLAAIADWMGSRSTTPAAQGESDADVLSASLSEDLPPTRLFARIDGMDLRMPALEPVAAGFHEASTSIAIEMLPVGRAAANHNTTRFQPPPTDLVGADYLVMASRGRAFPATSALDVALRPGEAVLAPVSGTVSDVRTYWLYGKYEDHRVEIVPDDAPHLRVVLVHVEGVRVADGERVEVGTTVLAEQANRFPFTSQIDRETEPELLGHVHLEVQPVAAPRPGD